MVQRSGTDDILGSHLHPLVVVDDDAGCRELITSILDCAGYSVVAAACVSDLMNVLEQVPAPGLILLDILMPGQDGLWALDELQRRGLREKVPVVAMTGLDMEPPAGTSAVLRKPFGPRELLEQVLRHQRGPV